MSNIIKSFRVIESDITLNNTAETNNSLKDKFIAEARIKHRTMILEAESKANEIKGDAHTRSREILYQAREKAVDIFQKAKDEGYDKGYIQGEKKGFKDGYETGFNQGKLDSEKLILEALNIKDEYIGQRNRLLKDAEKDLIELVISIYEKILYRKIEEDKELIISLVLNGLDSLEATGKLIILVPEENYEVVYRSKNKILAKASSVSELEIKVNSDMEKGDCIIKTSKGNVDISVDNQLKNVQELLMTILNNE